MDLLIATLLELQVNLYRLQNNLTIAERSNDVCEVAEGRLKEIQDSYQHNQLQNFDLAYGIWSENLGRIVKNKGTSFENSQEILKEWIESPKHNANLLANLDTFCIATNGIYYTFIGYKK